MYNGGKVNSIPVIPDIYLLYLIYVYHFPVLLDTKGNKFVHNKKDNFVCTSCLRGVLDKAVLPQSHFYDPKWVLNDTTWAFSSKTVLLL